MEILKHDTNYPMCTEVQYLSYFPPPCRSTGCDLMFQQMQSDKSVEQHENMVYNAALCVWASPDAVNTRDLLN